MLHKQAIGGLTEYKKPLYQGLSKPLAAHQSRQAWLPTTLHTCIKCRQQEQLWWAVMQKVVPIAGQNHVSLSLTVPACDKVVSSTGNGDSDVFPSSVCCFTKTLAAQNCQDLLLKQQHVRETWEGQVGTALEVVTDDSTSK
jgi:hypothetical protein